MRVCKGFVVLSLLTLALTATMPAQANDSLWVVPADKTVLNQAGTFSVTVVMNNATTTAQSITLPLKFGGANANLTCDVTVNDGFGNQGITQKTLGSNGTWTIRSSLVNNTNKTILIGYVSFGAGLPPANDSLVAVHFALTGGGTDAVHSVDTTTLPPSNTLTITDPSAVDVTPGWGKGAITIGSVSAGDDGITPLAYGLDQNYPNPFNAQTRINFGLARPGRVQLTVFNILGQEVKTLVDREMTADRHTIVWDGTSAQGAVVASGTYFYRLKIGDDFEETRQMTLLK
jgi:hypothetical protein